MNKLMITFLSIIISAVVLSGCASSNDNTAGSNVFAAVSPSGGFSKNA